MRIIIACLIILMFSPACEAAFKSSSDAVAPDAAWNPSALADDIVLPMPCGLSLAMRGVGISSGALLRDMRFPMGIANSQNQDRQIYERQFDGYIAAPFTTADLPADWRKKLKKSEGDADALYFIGKYEISNQQWNAVMDALDRDGAEDPLQCPKLDKKSALPVTNISWFEAQEFLNKYNAWLVRNHVEKLPSFKGGNDVAFFRLPTEEEWEYAARAYSKVPQEWWANHDIFRFAEDRSFDDYAVTSNKGALQAPLAIGSRLANPLGIHDTAGNVSEMVDGFFRMTIADMANGQVVRRLHGAAGGILTKGGSFRSSEEEAYPGAREELSLYSAGGPNKRSDLGFRVALAAVNIPNAQRLAALRREANTEPDAKRGAAPRAEGNTPLDMIASMVSRAEGAQKSDLERLRALVQDQESAFATQELRNLEQSFRSLLYEMESLRSFGLRYSQADTLLARLRNLLAKEQNPAVRKETQNAINAGQQDLKSYLQSLIMGAGHFKNTLGAISDYPAGEIERLLRQTTREYGANTIFDAHMRENLTTLAKMVLKAKKDGISSMNTKSILATIIPKVHYDKIKF